VTNTGSLPARSVYVSVGLYSSENALVGVAEGSITGLDGLEPGERITFTLLTNRVVAPVGNLHAQAIAEGRSINDD
jgi:hypothetical protein